MANRKRTPNLKKIRLPPTNLNGIETYLRNRGYRINPALQSDNSAAKLTFDKPLPDGRRIHGAVHEGRKSFKIKRHVDKHNPYHDPLGHLLEDCTTNIRNTISVVPKRMKKRNKRRRIKL